MTIQKAAVIGAGVMGSGIAAHLANAGIPVLLLDILPKDPNADRSAIAKGALEKLTKTDPAPFMTKKAMGLVTPGNIEDNLKDLAEVDWVVEAVIERVDIKRDLYAKLERVLKPGAIVSSNTSTIPLHDLVEGRGTAFRKNFLITHFFNPPRYMRLLEIVTSAETDPATTQRISHFCDVNLGKGVVVCHDRPGFIANRIGTYWIQQAFNEAFDRGLTVEEADLMMKKPMGFPMGVFALVDMIGLDLMPHIAKSLLNTLPSTDDYARIFRSEPLIEKMIADGYTGRKGKGGFYRLSNEGGKREKESISLKTGAYGKSGKAALESAEAGKKGLRAVLEHTDKGGQYAKAVLVPTLGYVASLVPEIAADIASVDAAMRWGYNWKHGPFEMMDALSADWLIAALKDQGRPVPDFLAKASGRSFYKVENGKRYQLIPSGDYAELKPQDGVLLLSDIKRASAPVAKNGSASLWDLGDGVLCVEFTSKMNAIDTDIFAMEKKAMDLVKAGKFKAIVIYNEGENFSVGANLGLAVFAINIGLFPTIEQLVSEGQETYKALKFAPFPVVAAPSGMALGGGCEVLLHVAHVQAHAETYCGLVEVGVGLIPGWGGCKEMLLRSRGKGGGPMPAVASAFETIGTAKVAKSAMEAKELGYFRKSDGITMNRDRLLFDAKQKALELAKDYKAPEPETLRLPGAGGKAALQLALDTLYLAGKATPYDMVVSDALAEVLSGGKKDMLDEVSEDDVLELERTAFMKLVKNEGTIARIEHMLANGKPLRN